MSRYQELNHKKHLPSSVYLVSLVVEYTHTHTHTHTHGLTFTIFIVSNCTVQQH